MTKDEMMALARENMAGKAKNLTERQVREIRKLLGEVRPRRSESR